MKIILQALFQLIKTRLCKIYLNIDFVRATKGSVQVYTNTRRVSKFIIKNELLRSLMVVNLPFRGF